MSLNRYEQAIFDYWQREPDERRHWQSKVADAARRPGEADATVRATERDLWDYLEERRPHVPALRALLPPGSGRVSLLNLAEHLFRLWGPPPKSKPPGRNSRTLP